MNRPLTTLLFAPISWIEQLPLSFSKNGLHLKAYDKIPVKDRYRLILGQSFLFGLDDLAGDANFVGVEKADDARKLIDAATAEFAQGVSMDMSFVCVVGRKEA